MTPLATDPVEVTQLLDARWYDERLRALADELGRDPDSVRAEAAGYLREMAASLDERAVQAWRGFSRWLMRAYDVLVDEDQITQLRKLDRKATLAFAFSHRSYLDGMLLPEAILANRLSPALTFGGANLNFFPMGAWAKRTGAIFIRRQTKDIPVYRFVLRAYAAQLVQNHVNLTWSIEGGRTRTGKLRPPVFGILRYITDAVDEIDGPEVYLVPTSIVYDQLHEVEAMTTEAYGAVKRPEDLRFLVRLARQQGERLGRAYLDFGEPLPLRKRLQEMRADKSGTGSEIERIALDVEHRINRATPVTPTAVVSLALLGADRSLSISEVLATVRVEPMRNFPVIRDLVVDISDFMAKLPSVKPWLVRHDEPPVEDGEYRQTPAELDAFKQFSMCINCMLCYSACPVYALDPDFLGPAAIALGQRYNLDSRDQGAADRRDVLAAADGAWACTLVGECSTACPKGVDPAGAIQRYKLTAATHALKKLLFPWGGG